MDFFVGVHHPHIARHFDRAFLSSTALRRRKGPFEARAWVMDSGAFTALERDGRFAEGPEDYAAEVRRWSRNGELVAAVSQDYLCVPPVLAKTGKSVAEHQELTIERYDAIAACDLGGVYLMPALQGVTPEDFARHVRAYGRRLAHGAWVGVGSLARRSRDTRTMEAILIGIKAERPDLRLHGFGLKLTALANPMVRDLLSSADSMAWSYMARRQGRDGNSWLEAKAFEQRIEASRLEQLTIFAGLGA